MRLIEINRLTELTHTLYSLKQLSMPVVLKLNAQQAHMYILWL